MTAKIGERAPSAGGTGKWPDVFRRHGEAWRAQNAGHVSAAGQLRVMSAIEACRTLVIRGSNGPPLIKDTLESTAQRAVGADVGSGSEADHKRPLGDVCFSP